MEISLEEGEIDHYSLELYVQSWGLSSRNKFLGHTGDWMYVILKLITFNLYTRVK